MNDVVLRSLQTTTGLQIEHISEPNHPKFEQVLLTIRPKKVRGSVLVWIFPKFALVKLLFGSLPVGTRWQIEPSQYRT